MDNNSIVINNIRILRKNNLSRLLIDIYVPNCDVFTVFFEVEELYSQYLSDDRADFALCLVLPLALKMGYNIRSEVPISESFLFNIINVLIPTLVHEDPKTKNISVSCPTIDNYNSSLGVGTGVSGGVDSSYTIMQYSNNDVVKSNKITHLFVTSTSIDLMRITENEDLYSWENKHKRYFKTYNDISKYCGLPLIKMLSNNTYFLVLKCRKNWPMYFHHITVHAYLTLCSVFALSKLFNIYYFSSGYHLTDGFSVKNAFDADTSHYDLLLMYALSTNSLMFYSAGGSVDRIKKAKALADFDVAQKTLHPCFCKSEKNCSLPKCPSGGNKCLRELLTFDYYDKLDNFKNMYNIDLYKKYRSVYLFEMIRQKSHPLLRPLYELFKEKYPSQMKTIEEKVNKNLKTVDGTTFNNLKRAYLVSLKLINKGNPKELLSSFFGDAKKIYLVGNNKLTNVITAILSDRYFCTDKEESIDSCDVCFISETDRMTMLYKKMEFESLYSKSVLTLDDLIRHCDNM